MHFNFQKNIFDHFNNFTLVNFLCFKKSKYSKMGWHSIITFSSVTKNLDFSIIKNEDTEKGVPYANVLIYNI